MTNFGEKHLPRDNELQNLVGIPEEISVFFRDTLLEPLATILHRPGKNFRASLVELGHACGANPNRQLPSLTKWKNLLEQMHAASLIIDDIQDHSESRRGAPTLHKNYGMPLALNAGNWLYFWQLWQIRQMGLKEKHELELTRLCIDTYLKAHFGQAIDIGIHVMKIPKAQIRHLSLMNMELKTGALMAFALATGAALAEIDAPGIKLLYSYGIALGKKLQMLDDLGNLHTKNGEKRYEDLREFRISWPIAKAAELLSIEDFARLKTLLANREFAGAESLLADTNVLTAARVEALAIAQGELLALESFFPHFPKQDFLNLEKKLEGAYE
jgi:geranylgeranyl pyrophosphate synthase